MSRCLLLLLMIVALTGCASLAREYRLSQYQNAAFKYSQAGDWKTAREELAKAVKEADEGNVDMRSRAVIYYEYGRAAGATCYYDIAEEYLKKANRFDFQTNGPEYMSLVELFRLNLDQKKYEQAINYFSEALVELDKVNASQSSPIEFAKLLDEYAVALNATGRHEEAQQAQARAVKLGEKGGYSITDRTPYGLYCQQ